MRSLIRKILRENINLLDEVMIPVSNEPHQNGENDYVVIAQDDKTNDFLLLFVELHNENDEHIFSYFLQVFNEEGIPLTKRLYKRYDAYEYLPAGLKPSIIPLVKKMTINLVNRVKPKIIKRVSVEKLNNKTMKRYDEITKLFQDILGYELTYKGEDDEGNDVWKFQNGDSKLEFDKKTLEEHYFLSSKIHNKILESAEKKTNEMIFKNWKEHRKLDEKNKK
jgi:hypothetical protein